MELGKTSSEDVSMMAGVTLCDKGRTLMVQEDATATAQSEEPFQKNPRKNLSGKPSCGDVLSMPHLEDIRG